MKNVRLLAVIGALTALIAVPLAHASGLWWGLPQIGGATYCVTQNTAGVPGTTAQCTSTTLAGPAVFTGNEVVPIDIFGPAAGVTNAVPSTAYVGVVQFNQGPMIDQTTVGTAQTIPNNTPWFFLDGAQGSAFTVTMPATAIEGQTQNIICEAATVGALTVTANTTVVTQVVKLPVAAACVAGVGYAWRYQASNLTWYRIR